MYVDIVWVMGYGLWVVVYMCEPTSDRDSGVGYQDTSHIRLYTSVFVSLSCFPPVSLKACASYTYKLWTMHSTHHPLP